MFLVQDIRPSSLSRPLDRRRRRRKITFTRHQPQVESNPTRRLKSVAERLDSVQGTYPDVLRLSRMRARVQARSWVPGTSSPPCPFSTLPSSRPCTHGYR